MNHDWFILASFNAFFSFSSLAESPSWNLQTTNLVPWFFIPYCAFWIDDSDCKPLLIRICKYALYNLVNHRNYCYNYYPTGDQGERRHGILGWQITTSPTNNGLLMCSTVQMCFAANNILLTRNTNHAFLWKMADVWAVRDWFWMWKQTWWSNDKIFLTRLQNMVICQTLWLT